jgi:hypothetical protein
MQQLLKENLTWVLIIIAVIAGVYFTVIAGKQTFEAVKSNIELKKQEEDLQQKLEALKAQSLEQPKVEVEGGKKIFEAQDMAFSTEASFAPLFEVFVDRARASGIRIRSIEYNYTPTDDPIVVAAITGYNVCELKIVAVGNFLQFQNFFKNITKEEYLMFLPEIELKPWENDNTVLISTFKLRLYTKT